MSSITPGAEVPVIDLSRFLAGQDPTETVELLRHACENIGFFQVVGHNVPQEALKAVELAMSDLAQRPSSELEALTSPTGHPFRGVEVRRGALGNSPDGEVAVIRLQACRFEDQREAEVAGVSTSVSNYFVPNVWPSQPENLRETFTDLFEHTRSLGRSLMQLIALALKLPRDYFEPMLVLDASTISANYYPPQQKLSVPGEPNVTLLPHTDSGVITLLYQNGDYTGLQLQASDGSWIDVPVVGDAFIINLGDLISRWTNDHWRSTTHRVVAAEEAGRSRISIPTFFLPALDTPVETFEVFLSDADHKYEPITPYQWESVYLSKYYPSVDRDVIEAAS